MSSLAYILVTSLDFGCYELTQLSHITTIFSPSASITANSLGELGAASYEGSANHKRWHSHMTSQKNGSRTA